MNKIKLLILFFLVLCKNRPDFGGGHGSQGSPQARPTEQQHVSLVSFDIMGCSQIRRGNLDDVL